MLTTLLNWITPPPAAPTLPSAPNASSDAIAERARPLRTCRLLMVTANNNNKFYDMAEREDGTFSVTYGRVGTAGAVCSYPIRQWDAKYREKISKGYQDQTGLFVAHKENTDECAAIPDATARNLMRQLMQYAKQSISYHYNVNASQVSEKQIDEAQELINSLMPMATLAMDVTGFNEQLLRLYHVIPRRMKNVRDHLVQAPKADADIEVINQLLYAEQCTLDVMRGQVKLHQQQVEQPEQNPANLLEIMGLKVELVSNTSEIKTVKKLMGDSANLLKSVYSVVNLRTEELFLQALSKSQHQKTELFWHGSRNENWLSIVETGLVLRPSNAIINGKMFGYGVYFADKFAKSLNYSSFRGAYWSGGNANQAFLALYKVHVGKQLKIAKHESWCYDLNDEKLKERGKQYDSLFAKGGVDLVNNEYIVYRENQCTIQYLVEIG